MAACGDKRFPSLLCHISQLLHPYWILSVLTHLWVAFVVFNDMFPSLWLSLGTQCHPCLVEPKGWAPVPFFLPPFPIADSYSEVFGPLFIEHALSRRLLAQACTGACEWLGIPGSKFTLPFLGPSWKLSAFRTWKSLLYCPLKQYDSHCFVDDLWFPLLPLPFPVEAFRIFPVCLIFGTLVTTRHGWGSFFHSCCLALGRPTVLAWKIPCVLFDSIFLSCFFSFGFGFVSLELLLVMICVAHLFSRIFWFFFFFWKL